MPHNSPCDQCLGSRLASMHTEEEWWRRARGGSGYTLLTLAVRSSSPNMPVTEMRNTSYLKRDAAVQSGTGTYPRHSVD